MEAILIAGNEKRFKDALSDFRKYLIEEVGLERVSILRIGHLIDRLRIIWRLLRSVPHSQFLIYYFGHGSKKGWEAFDYKDLCPLFLKSRSQIFLINECCHAGSIIPILESCGALPQKMGVITSSPESEECHGREFMDELLQCWRNRENYDPEKHSYVIEKGGDFTVKKEVISTEQRDGWTIERVCLNVQTDPVEEVNFLCPRWGFVFDYLFFSKK